MTARPDPVMFEEATARFRRELLAHCYRMTGSVHEAEDLVQETYLRAWRAFDRFEHRSSVRTWLYRIATNVCLTALGRRRRWLPSMLGPPSLDPYSAPVTAPDDVAWIEPVPDSLVLDERADPGELVAARQSVRLALVAGLQLLPPRQKAALLLRDVLTLSAAEAADVLDVSVASLKSLLQRARRALADMELSDDDIAEPTDPGARAVLDRYIAAFERSDMDELEQLLADEAMIDMTGTTTWFAGKATCGPYLARQAIGRAGDWRLLPVRANGQLAAAAYHRHDDGVYRPFGISILATTSTRITHITLFDNPAVFARFEAGRHQHPVHDEPLCDRQAR